ncbi:Uncharacterised protein [Mycobacteroides abscessus subsp. abscessus]|nr:Uncharacterised protein [Mycobacteroides abscessus subsp. abscessus]
MPLPRVLPSSSIVHSFVMSPGKRDFVSAITEGTTGRNPCLAQICCASSVNKKSTKALAAGRSFDVLTTATGFSILNVCGGIRYSTCELSTAPAFLRCSMIASFS